MTTDDPTASAETPRWLADNLRALRQARGLTQLQCATLAQVPRPTWASLESGAANPTLSVVVKVAAALGVTLDELVGPPRAACAVFPAAELREQRRRGVVVRELLPEPLVGLQIERLAFDAGAAMTGRPHTPGTREWLTCERGRVELRVAGQRFELAPGDVAVFPGDQKHSYRALDGALAVAYSVISLARGDTE